MNAYELRKWLGVLVVLMALGPGVNAQEVQVVDRYDEYFGKTEEISKAGFLSLRGDANTKDASIGGTLGVINEKRNLIFFGSFDARPFYKSTSEYIGKNTYYQYRESRYFIGVGMEYQKSFQDTDFGAFVQINPEYTWGNNAGTNRKASSGWIIVPRIGVFKKFGQSSLALGYAMVDAKNDNIQKNRIYLSLNNVLGRIR